MSDLCKMVCSATHVDCISDEPLLLALHMKDSDDAVQGPVPSRELPMREVPRYGPQVAAVVEQCQKKNARKDKLWICTFWALTPATRYVVKVCHTKEDGAPTDEPPQSLSLQTVALPSPYGAMFTTRAAVHTLSSAQLLVRPDFAGCPLSQGDSSYMYMIAPEPFSFSSVTVVLPLLFYHGLFALPNSVQIAANVHLWLFMLPNPPKRCVLDLQDAALDRKDGETPSVKGELATSDCAYPWRRSKKVKRLLASEKYACVVRDTPSGIEAALRRAAAYHEGRHEGTWLLAEFITALAHLRPLSSLGAARPPTTSTLKILVVEMVERASGRVVAGCCGFALGCVYHDFTMYTLDRTAAAAGTVLTKVLGEALQRCGYNLWYWGMFISYMEQFRAAYGLKELDREVFYKRWNEYRERQPRACVDSFLRHGNGMLPYFTGS